MHAFLPHNSMIVTVLKDAGIIPSECFRFELLLETNRPISAKCEFYLTEKQLDIIAEAMKRDHEAGKRVIREVVLRAMPDAENNHISTTVLVELEQRLQSVNVSANVADQ